MSDAVWLIDENGARRFKSRRVARRDHPDWREESRAPKKSSASAENEPAEQAEADKPARKGTTK